MGMFVVLLIGSSITITGWRFVIGISETTGEATQ